MTEKDLIRKANVVYVIPGTKVIGGMDTGRPAIVVGVMKKITPRKEAIRILGKKNLIPTKIHGKETDVIEVEEIKALRTSKHRPAPGGVSIGHKDITAGTLGMMVNINGDRFILGNNHVLANSNDASIGDPIYQPGPYDGGTPADTIGHLFDFMPIVFNGAGSNCPIGKLVVNAFNNLSRLLRRKTRIRTYQDIFNLVDAAIARPINDNDVSESILEIGIPYGWGNVVTGDMVKKSGRTTGLTRGTVTAIDAITNVNYGDKMATFTDQIMTTCMSEGGDSGSVVLNKDNEVVGLLFAGSSQVTIVNKIQNVLEALNLNGGNNE